MSANGYAYPVAWGKYQAKNNNEGQRKGKGIKLKGDYVNYATTMAGREGVTLSNTLTFTSSASYRHSFGHVISLTYA